MDEKVLEKMVSKLVKETIKEVLGEEAKEEKKETASVQSATGKKRGRPKKQQAPTDGQMSLVKVEAENVNISGVPNSEITDSAAKVMKAVYKMLNNSSKNKYDIIAFLQQQVQNNNSLSVIFGDITDEMVEEVRTSNIHEEDPGSVEVLLNDNMQFEVLNVAKMDKSVKKSLMDIPSIEEARFLEDIYYQTQSKRIVIENQLRSLRQGADNDIEDNKSSQNLMFLEWYLYNMQLMEDQIKKALEVFSNNNYLSKWAKKNIGIGPVFATRLVANLEIKEDEFGNVSTHAGSWWSYCGLNDNNRPWLSRETSKKLVNEAIEENDGILDDDAVKLLCEKTKWKLSFYEENCLKENGTWDKEKLASYSSVVPYNKRLKTLMHLIGHSFMLSKNKEGSLYGKLLKQRMDYENEKNLRGDYADQAAKKLATTNIGKSTTAYQYYSKGQLPPAHITARCTRYVTKMFISHLYEAAYYNKYGKQAPNPYILCFSDQHHDYIGPEVPYDSVERD